MHSIPLCPHCSTPLIDKGDIPTFNFEDIAYGDHTIWVLWCGNCGKVISAFGYSPPKNADE